MSFEDSDLNSGFDITVTRAPINYVGPDEVPDEQKQEYIKFLRKQRKAERNAALLKTTVKRVKI